MTLPLYRYFASVNSATEEIVTVQLKLFVSVQKVCYGLFIDKTCVRDFLSGNPLNTDTPITRIFWHVPSVSVLTGFHCIITNVCMRSALQQALKNAYP